MRRRAFRDLRTLAARTALGIVLAGALGLVGLTAAVAAPADSPASVTTQSIASDTWTSGVQVQNIDSVPIQVTLNYYNASGTLVASEAPITLSPGARYTYDTFSGTMHAPAGFSGSAVVSATGKVSAVVNVLTTAGTPSLFESYGGVGGGVTATSLYLPIVQHNNGGYTSQIYVQNTDSQNTNAVTLTFYGPSGAVGSATQTIAPGGTWVYDTANSNLPSSFRYGSAVISAAKPVAAIASQTNGSQLLYYSGFSPAQAGTQVSAPLLFNRHVAPPNGYGWITGLQVQNVDATQTAQVQLVVGGQVKDTRSIPPGSSYTWSPYANNAYWGEVASGQVVSTNGVKLIGVVNELNPELGQAMSYDAFANGGTVANIALTQHANHGWESGQQVQNVGGAPAVATYTQYDGNGNVAFTDTETIPAGGQFIWSYYSMPNKPWPTTGSATVTTSSSGASLVAVVNQINPTSYANGDSSSVYDAVTQ